MFVDLPPDLPPVIMLAQAQKNQTAVPQAIGWCLITENNPGQLVQSEGIPAFFRGAARNYIAYFGDGLEYHSEKQWEALRQAARNAKVTIIQPPEHGRLVHTETYIPDQGYYGQDKVVARVDFASGEQVTVVFFIHMVHHGIQESEESILEFCGPEGEMWKISALPEGTDLANWYQNLSLQSLLAGTKDAQVGFSDLSGAAVAKTMGKGADAQIILDTDAAGHGWYIDYTPYLNEEWLPTSKRRYRLSRQPYCGKDGR
jgi:hypothetical protein